MSVEVGVIPSPGRRVGINSARDLRTRAVIPSEVRDLLFS
jgi:hypothetical protein